MKETTKKIVAVVGLMGTWEITMMLAYLGVS